MLRRSRLSREPQFPIAQQRIDALGVEEDAAYAVFVNHTVAVTAGRTAQARLGMALLRAYPRELAFLTNDGASRLEEQCEAGCARRCARTGHDVMLYRESTGEAKHA